MKKVCHQPLDFFMGNHDVANKLAENTAGKIDRRAKNRVRNARVCQRSFESRLSAKVFQRRILRGICDADVDDSLDIGLFGYIGAGSTLMSVPIKPSGSSLEVSSPTSLFETHLLPDHRSYDVSADGRFLLNVIAAESTAPVTVILNWKPKP